MVTQYIPNFLANAIFGLLLFAIAILKKVRNRTGYSSLFLKWQSQKSSRPKPSILKELRYILRTRFLATWLSLLSFPLHASFIESSIGTAVINDATATYYNPAALTLLKKPQGIAQGSAGYFRENFIGQYSLPSNHYSSFGNAREQANNYLPALYIGIPTKDKLNFGVAVISNFLNSAIDQDSILRYRQASARIQDVDFTPGVGVQINEYLSIGGGMTYSSALIFSNPISGFPSLELPDFQGSNVTRSTGYSGNIGFLLKTSPSTLIGFNYRSALSFEFNGTSTTQGLSSNHYQFDYWIPARSVLTMSHYFQPNFALIGTIKRVEWGVFDVLKASGIATRVGTQSTILSEVNIPYHFHNIWGFTLGSIRKISSKWVIRVAGTFEQSPGNGNYQITNGDNFIVGASTGYKVSENITIDASYDYGFQKNQKINIVTNNDTVTGVDKGFRNGVSLKLTVTGLE